VWLCFMRLQIYPLPTELGVWGAFAIVLMHLPCILMAYFHWIGLSQKQLLRNEDLVMRIVFISYFPLYLSATN